METRIKYPRTPHLWFSPGVSLDDIVQKDTHVFKNKEVVCTVKMDGQNTTLYSDGMHARSVNDRHHPSQARLRSWHAFVASDIAPGMRLVVEDCTAVHSIAYGNLPAYHFLLSVWQGDTCLDWATTQEWAALLGIAVPPVLYSGIWDEARIRKLYTPEYHGDTMEGFVVRLAAIFTLADFGSSVAKYVRPGHVPGTADHWQRGEYRQNGLIAGTEIA